MSSPRKTVKAVRGYVRRKENRENQPITFKMPKDLPWQDAQPITFKMPKDLPWQDACETPFERLAYLQDTGELADVTIVFPQEDKTIMTHKIVLGMSSPVFKNLLYGSFSEASEKNSTITLPDDSSEVFKILLDHIYKGIINVEDIEDAQEVYAMAHKYQIKSLVCSCFKFLKKALTTENVLEIYDFAAFYDDKELMKTCVSVINTSADMVMSSEKIHDVSQSGMRHLLMNDALDVSSEIVMFQALLSWIRNMTKNFDRSEITEIETDCVTKEEDSGKVNVVKEEPDSSTDMSSETQSKSSEDIVVKDDLEQSKDLSIDTQSKSTSLSSARQYLSLIRFLTMTTEEFCSNVLPLDLLDGEEIKVVLMHIISYELAPPLPAVVSCSHRSKRSRYAPSAMVTCRLANTSSKELKSSGKSASNGLIISQLIANKTLLIGGINLGKSTFATTKSIITFCDDYRGEFARVKGDRWDFSNFKFETPMKLEANRNVSIRISEHVDTEICKLKIGSFSNQEGDLTLNGNCIQDVNIDVYLWT